MKKPIKFSCFAILFLLSMILTTNCKNQKEETVEEETVEEVTFDIQKAKDEIIAANNEYERRFATKDSVGISNLYAKDAKLMINGSPAIIGRDGIRSTVAGLMNSGITIALETIDVWGNEELITEEGVVTLLAGENRVDEAKYLVLWKKIDGKWHLFRDIFNSNLPPAQE